MWINELDVATDMLFGSMGEIESLDKVTREQFQRLFLYVRQTSKLFYSYSTQYLNQVSFQNNICDSLKSITVACGTLSVICDRILNKLSEQKYNEQDIDVEQIIDKLNENSERIG